MLKEAMMQQKILSKTYFFHRLWLSFAAPNTEQQATGSQTIVSFYTLIRSWFLGTIGRILLFFVKNFHLNCHIKVKNR